MQIKHCFFIFFILISQSFAYAGEKIVHVATLADYSPFCFSKENKQPDKKPIVPGSDSTALQGYSWDVLRESYHAMGYSIDLLIHPWNRVERMLNKGKVDIIFPVVKTEKRNKVYTFAQEIVDVAKFLVYTRKESDIQWSGLDSLKGLRIGFVRGWSYGDHFNKFTLFQKRPVDKIMQGFIMLDKKRIDGYVGYEIPYDYALKQANMTSKFKKLPSFEESKEYLVGLKSDPHAQKLLNVFDTGKRKIIQNGVFDHIEKKWR
jgi:polar amino acid transport system substrate-binding protein